VTSSEIIYKILPAGLWSQATAAGAFAGSPLDVADGYIHFSTAAQVRETAAKHFAGMTDLLLIAVPAVALGAKLKWEPSRGGDLFPHLYSSLPITDALWVKPLPLDGDGRHVFPELVMS
jgi:uncharacterized protein (DUF952 family)